MPRSSSACRAGSAGQVRSFLRECWELADPAAQEQDRSTGSADHDWLPCHPVLTQQGRVNPRPHLLDDLGRLTRCPGGHEEAIPGGVTPADLPVDWFLEWDERAAMMEYHGGMSRDRAEALALEDILRQIGESKSDLSDQGAIDHE